MATDKNGGHRDDTAKVTFWVPKNVLARWDAFCDKEGIKRTQLIISASNEWIRMHSTDAKSAVELMALKEKQEQLVEKMDKVLGGIAAEERKEPSVENSDELRGRILKLIERVPTTQSDIAAILKADSKDVVTVLAGLKDDKLVSKNKKGEWSSNAN